MTKLETIDMQTLTTVAGGFKLSLGPLGGIEIVSKARAAADAARAAAWRADGLRHGVIR